MEGLTPLQKEEGPGEAQDFPFTGPGPTILHRFDIEPVGV
jgi:hypothetical protein